MNNSLYIQYGCGFSSPQGWRNFDSSPTLRFERIPVVGKLYTKNDKRFPDNVEYGDITRGLPVEHNSAEIVYCSHVLEHLPLESLRIALRNTWAMLKPGGVFRMVLPDLEFYVRQYLDSPAETRSDQFMRETSLGVAEMPKGFIRTLMYCMGNSQHAWMWDYPSLKQELIDAGFVGIRRAEYMDNPDPMFTDIEEQSRWENSLGIECQKL